MFKPESRFISIEQLLATDNAAVLDDEDFDTELWHLFWPHVGSPSDLENQPLEAMHYYASRLVQWEVGNGGFGQAVENIYDWMPFALIGYEALQEHKGAALIRSALEIVSKNRNNHDVLFNAFEILDKQYNPDIWEVDKARIAYVRVHREALSKIHWKTDVLPVN